MTRALVALGSNLGARREQLDAAVAALAALPGTAVLAVAPLIETAPVDAPPGSGAFLNGACLLETALSPETLLAALAALEDAAGRQRSERNAPRTLDLDLLLHGQNCRDTPALQLPHPRLHERLFVLEPAAALAPDWVHPRLHRTLAELRDACRRQSAEDAACRS